MVQDFEWNREDDAVRAQARTAAYFNGDGDLVLRQENESRGEDDTIVIARNNIRQFIDKLHKLARAADEEDGESALDDVVDGVDRP